MLGICAASEGLVMHTGCITNIKLFYRRLSFLWRCGDTRPATICVILSGYLWAGMLAWPGETVARPTYRHMKDLLPNDMTWAALFFVVASLQVWRLFSLTTERAKWWDFTLKITACVLYAFVFIACTTSLSPVPAAMADNAVIAFAAWWDLSRWDIVRGCGARSNSHGGCPYE